MPVMLAGVPSLSEPPWEGSTASPTLTGWITWPSKVPSTKAVKASPLTLRASDAQAGVTTSLWAWETMISAPAGRARKGLTSTMRIMFTWWVALAWPPAMARLPVSS